MKHRPNPRRSSMLLVCVECERKLSNGKYRRRTVGHFIMRLGESPIASPSAIFGGYIFVTAAQSLDRYYLVRVAANRPRRKRR